MKKKLDQKAIVNELREGSVFFRPPHAQPPGAANDQAEAEQNELPSPAAGTEGLPEESTASETQASHTSYASTLASKLDSFNVSSLASSGASIIASKKVSNLASKKASAQDSRRVAKQSSPDDRQQESRQASQKAIKRNMSMGSYQASLVEPIRKRVKVLGREVSFTRLTPEEKGELIEIVHTFKMRGMKTSENEVNRIAVNFLLEDYKSSGDESLLARVLAALRA